MIPIVLGFEVLILNFIFFKMVEKIIKKSYKKRIHLIISQPQKKIVFGANKFILKTRVF
jgi:hypothetical protein